MSSYDPTTVVLYSALVVLPAAPLTSDSIMPNNRNPNDSLSPEQINELDEETAVRSSFHFQWASELIQRLGAPTAFITFSQYQRCVGVSVAKVSRCGLLWGGGTRTSFSFCPLDTVQRCLLRPRSWSYQVFPKRL